MTDEAKKEEVLEEVKEEIWEAEEVKEETTEKVLSPEEEIGKLKAEIEDWKQSYLRKQADFQNFTKRKEKEKNDRLIQSITINQMEARQNEEIINSTHSLRVFKHDIMNHMSILYKLVENGKNSDALKYIYQINNSIERTSYTISTGIIPIDCIMTAKLSKALDNNISIKHQIHFPANYNISDMDLCSLISNLLDNAIEANCKLDITKRRLQIEIKPYNNMLLLFISNSSNGIYLYGGNGNLLTTKTSNKNEHGIGIKRINEIVKKYNGIIEFDPGTEIFSVSILFPLDNWLEDN